MSKLTKRFVDSVVVGNRDVVLWDDELPRFGLRVSGAMTYIVQYRNSAGRTQLRWIGRTSRSGSLKERRLNTVSGMGRAVTRMMAP